MLVTVMVIIHLVMLHEKGSSNQMQTQTNTDKVKFLPLFLIKDRIPLILTILLTGVISINNPFLFGDPETFLTANPLIAPVHIQPE